MILEYGIESQEELQRLMEVKSPGRWAGFSVRISTDVEFVRICTD